MTEQMSVEQRQEFFADLAKTHRIALYIDESMQDEDGTWRPVAAVATGGYYEINVPCVGGDYENAKVHVQRLNHMLFGLNPVQADEIVASSFRGSFHR